MKKLKAAFDAVIVEPLPLSEIETGGIIVPDMGKTKNLRGIVVDVGPGKYTVTGQFIPTEIKIGEEVILPTLGPVSVDFDNKEYYVCAENQILAIIKNEEQ